MSRSQLTKEQLKQIKPRECWIEVSPEFRGSDVYIARVFEQGYESEWYHVVRTDKGRAVRAALNNFGFASEDVITVYEFGEPRASYYIEITFDDSKTLYYGQLFLDGKKMGEEVSHWDRNQIVDKCLESAKIARGLTVSVHDVKYDMVVP